MSRPISPPKLGVPAVASSRRHEETINAAESVKHVLQLDKRTMCVLTLGKLPREIESEFMWWLRECSDLTFRPKLLLEEDRAAFRESFIRKFSIPADRADRGNQIADGYVDLLNCIFHQRLSLIGKLECVGCLAASNASYFSAWLTPILAPFETLYGLSCRRPIHVGLLRRCAEAGGRTLIYPLLAPFHPLEVEITHAPRHEDRR